MCANAKDMSYDVGKLDEETLNSIEATCKDHAELHYESLQHIALKDMGYIIDENIKCHLLCNPMCVEAKLIEFVEQRLHTDVRVIVQGHSFDCHLAVLHYSTVYFKQFDSGDDIVINSNEVSKVGFEQAYDWMCQRHAIPQSEHILELYLTANYLNMPDLTNQLWYCFQNTEFYSDGHAFKLYLQALPHAAKPLKALLLTQMSRFFLSAVATEEFLQLKPLDAYAMLSNSIISVNSEIEVLMSALRWLMFDWETRQSYIPLLMRAVRFNLLPAWYTVSLQGEQTQPELREILEHPAVQSMINGGLSYSITQHFLDVESPLQENLQMANAGERDWIIDTQAAHHHLYKCPNWQFLNFQRFNSYLQQIINSGPHFSKSLLASKHTNLLPCCQVMAKTS